MPRMKAKPSRRKQKSGAWVLKSIRKARKRVRPQVVDQIATQVVREYEREERQAQEFLKNMKKTRARNIRLAGGKKAWLRKTSKLKEEFQHAISQNARKRPSS